MGLALAALRAHRVYSPFFPGTSRLAPCKQEAFRDVFAASLCLMHPPRKPFCCKKERSGINYPRGTRAAPAPATPEPFLSLFCPFPPSPPFCQLLHRDFVSGQSNFAPPGGFGTFGRIKVKQGGNMQARGQARGQLSSPMDTHKSQPAHLITTLIKELKGLKL